MPQSLSAVYIHAVFSTKNRHPFLRDPILRQHLHTYLGAISKKLNCAPLRIGGVEDHVHLLCRQSRTTTQAEWIKEMKRVSSGWLKTRTGPSASPEARCLPEFAWQAGYGCFSVSSSNLERVILYIERQVEHHRKFTFQDEFRTLLKKHGESWDENYVWD